MTPLEKEFEATGYSAWVNSDLYPDNKVHTREYVNWLEKKLTPLEEGKPSEEPENREQTIWIEWLKKRIVLTHHQEDLIKFALGELQDHNKALQSEVEKLNLEKVERFKAGYESSRQTITALHAEAESLQREKSNLKAEVERLKGMNEQWIRIWSPILDYCQDSKNAERLGIKPGESISEKVLSILKSLAQEPVKSAHDVLTDFGLPEIPFDENVKMYYPAIINAMEEYANQFKPKHGG